VLGYFVNNESNFPINANKWKVGGANYYLKRIYKVVWYYNYESKVKKSMTNFFQKCFVFEVSLMRGIENK